MAIPPKRFHTIEVDKYPSWITKEALWVLEEYAQFWLMTTNLTDFEMEPRDLESWQSADKERVIANLKRLSACLASKELRKVWQKVGEIVNKENPTKGQVWFAAAILDSCIHPRDVLINKSSAQAWRQSLLKNLKRILEQLEEMPTNYGHWFHDYKFKAFKSYTEIDPNEIGINAPGLSYMLYSGVLHPYFSVKQVYDSLNEVDYDPLYSGAHVQGENAIRQYFCRALSTLLYRKTGKKCRAIVASTTSIAFDSNIEVREVIRLTKNIHSAESYFRELHSGKWHIKLYLEGAAEAQGGGTK
ncbi:MAG: hypothetical protein R3F50_11315 [Gammaproteobacteria bacterium]